jgi:hypothetical protein
MARRDRVVIGGSAGAIIRNLSDAEGAGQREGG